MRIFMLVRCKSALRHSFLRMSPRRDANFMNMHIERGSDFLLSSMNVRWEIVVTRYGPGLVLGGEEKTSQSYAIIFEN